MDQTNQGNNSGASADVPLKRKRGRPRKDKSLASEKDLRRVEIVRAPPGFVGANGNQSHQGGAVENARDAMLGQPVSGVVEAAFDAGYLLTVRVGNSDTTLRGVVFRPGRCVPISAENDVAPNVQMIRRNEIPLSRRHNQSQVHGSNPRSRERHEQHRNGASSHPSVESQVANQVSRVAPRAANLIPSQAKHLALVPTQAVNPIALRGNVVPVRLTPVNLSNGIVPLSPAPHLAASKSKLVPPLALQLSDGPTNQVLHQNKTNLQVAPTGVQKEDGLIHQPMAEVSHGVEAKPTPGNVPFQTLLGEVMKKSASQTQMSGKDSSFTSETGLPNMNEPLSIKPLQAVQPESSDQSVSVPKPTRNDRTGKMTELLQVLQQNMMENEQPDKASSHEQGSQESEVEDKETIHSNKRSRASSV